MQGHAGFAGQQKYAKSWPPRLKTAHRAIILHVFGLQEARDYDVYTHNHSYVPSIEGPGCLINSPK